MIAYRKGSGHEAHRGPLADGGGIAVLSRHEQAASIALEHVRWAQANGQTPRMILRALGLCRRPGATWDDAFAALASAWLIIEASKDIGEAA